LPRCRVEYHVALEPPGTKNWLKTVDDARQVLSAAGIRRPKDAGNKFTHFDALVAVLTLAAGKEEQQELWEAEDAIIPENVSPAERAKWGSGIAWQLDVADNLRKEKLGANMKQLARALITENPQLVLEAYLTYPDPIRPGVSDRVVESQQALSSAQQKNALLKLGAQTQPDSPRHERVPKP